MVVPMPAWDGARGSLGMSLVLAARRCDVQLVCSSVVRRTRGQPTAAPICKEAGELASVLLDASTPALRLAAFLLASLQNRV